MCKTFSTVIIVVTLLNLFVCKTKESQYDLDHELLFLTSQPFVGELEKVKKLVEKGASLEIKNDFDMTPLLNAAYIKNGERRFFTDNVEEKQSELEAVKIVKFLISKGADKSATDYKRNNAIHLAAYGGRDKMVQTLLELGFSVNEQNKAGATPLIIAVASGSLETVKFLVSKGADINHTTKENATALDIAKQYEHKEIADYLENLGVKESFAK